MRKVCELQVNPLNQLMDSRSQAKIVRYLNLYTFKIKEYRNICFQYIRSNRIISSSQPALYIQGVIDLPLLNPLELQN